jgi:hypothetical protein
MVLQNLWKQIIKSLGSTGLCSRYSPNPSPASLAASLGAGETRQVLHARGDLSTAVLLSQYLKCTTVLAVGLREGSLTGTFKLTPYSEDQKFAHPLEPRAPTN